MDSQGTKRHIRFFSKIIDPDDWEITDSFFEHLDELWGPFTIDRFASSNNNKAERFNSKYAVPDTEAVDAFTQDQRFDNNLLVPPVSYLIKTINYLKKFNIRGALMGMFTGEWFFREFHYRLDILFKHEWLIKTWKLQRILARL